MCPRKVRDITGMPRPTDIAGVQRFLGVTQYLGSFLPRVSDMTKPLRDVTQKDIEFLWDEPQQKALDALKAAVTSTPVLRCYNLDEKVTLQCDASQSGLGVAVLQGQPVAFTSLAPSSNRD